GGSRCMFSFMFRKTGGYTSFRGCSEAGSEGVRLRLHAMSTSGLMIQLCPQRMLGLMILLCPQRMSGLTIQLCPQRMSGSYFD
ncbi:hypothetical protein L9F63_026227, partial [Diploptera punctata]